MYKTIYDNPYAVFTIGEPVILTHSEKNIYNSIAHNSNLGLNNCVPNYKYIGFENYKYIGFENYKAYNCQTNKLEKFMYNKYFSVVKEPKNPNSWIVSDIAYVIDTIREMVYRSKCEGKKNCERYYKKNYWYDELYNIIEREYEYSKRDDEMPSLTLQGIPINIFAPDWCFRHCASEHHSITINYDTFVNKKTEDYCICWTRANIDNKIKSADIHELIMIAEGVIQNYVYDDILVFIIWRALYIHNDAHQLLDLFELSSDSLKDVVDCAFKLNIERNKYCASEQIKYINNNNYNNYIGWSLHIPYDKKYNIFLDICKFGIYHNIIDKNNAITYAIANKIICSNNNNFWKKTFIDECFWTLRDHRMNTINYFGKTAIKIGFSYDVINIITSFIWPVKHVSEYSIEELVCPTPDSRTNDEIFSIIEKEVGKVFAFAENQDFEEYDSNSE